MKFNLLITLIALPCLACSSVIEGTSQEIEVVTNPAGASCTLVRQGQPIAKITPTPGTALIKKTKYDITVNCDKTGYAETTFLDHSGAAGATFGNIILGGGIGWAIDSASGADNKYDSPVNMTLLPAPAGTPTTQTKPSTETGAPTS